MSQMFNFRENTHFITGAIGEPGKRVFYIQAGDITEHITIKVEKQQVAALSKFLHNLLEDLPEIEQQPLTDAPPKPREPLSLSWTGGEITVGVEPANSLLVVSLEELLPFDTPPEETPLLHKARIFISPEQANLFIVHTRRLLAKGRPPCQLCGQPEDPQGHICPRLN